MVHGQSPQSGGHSHHRHAQSALPVIHICHLQVREGPGMTSHLCTRLDLIKNTYCRDPRTCNFWALFVIFRRNFVRFDNFENIRFSMSILLTDKSLKWSIWTSLSKRKLKSSHDPRLVMPGILCRKEARVTGVTPVLATSKCFNFRSSVKLIKLWSVTETDPWTSSFPEKRNMSNVLFFIFTTEVEAVLTYFHDKDIICIILKYQSLKIFDTRHESWCLRLTEEHWPGDIHGGRQGQMTDTRHLGQVPDQDVPHHWGDSGHPSHV